MKFTLDWLKQHLSTDASVSHIADALTDLGLEVEAVVDPAATLARFTLGKVVDAEPHSDADRLRVCKVETDEGLRQIICGAPNARAGITVGVAKPGDYVPGIDTTIGVGKIRGIESHGMMASERELELSDEHDGIIELPSGEVGQSFASWMAEHAPERIDPMIEIAVTPNRADALGVRGIARDLAARGLGTLIDMPLVPTPGTFPCPLTVRIDADTLDACPVFYGRLIRGVKNGPSPDWLTSRLKAIGLRPISALVDVTNFFTYDRNRPLHVFDANQIKGGLRVHRAQGGETMIGLDEKEYRFEPGMTLISDEAGPESIAGVMGGLRSGCTEETSDVFIEAAYFDPVRTALTGRALKVHSDARYRFERGIDPSWTRHGLEAATQLILELCGGEASEVVAAGQIPDTRRSYAFDPDRLKTLVGMDIPAAEQLRALTALGFRVEDGAAHVPSWRPDILGDADIVEEVARVASLTKLRGQPLPRLSAGVPKPVLTRGQRREATARRTLASLGYNECVTYSFIDQAAAALFGGGGTDHQLENPISSEMSHMRPSLLPGLLQAAARNQARGFSDVALSEVGVAFHGGQPGEQKLSATGLLVGATGPRDPHGSRRQVDVFDAKAHMETVLAAVGAPSRAQTYRATSAWWHPGRSGVIGLGPKVALAAFGEVHPKIVSELGVKGRAVAFTVHLDAIPQSKARSINRGALDISGLQVVERDFAFVLDADIGAGDVVSAAASADKKLIADVAIFDEFVGGALGPGKKSLAVTVSIQPVEKTLTEEQIEAVGAKVIEKVMKATGGTLRT